MKTMTKYPNEADLMAALRALKRRTGTTAKAGGAKRSKRAGRNQIAPICFNRFG